MDVSWRRGLTSVVLPATGVDGSLRTPLGWEPGAMLAPVNVPEAIAPTMIRPAEIAPAPWTLFVYLNADNNLAPFALEDLQEMERVGSSPGKLNVIALVDGSNVYPGLPSRARLLYIERGRSREIAIDPRSELGQMLAATRNEANMGDPMLLRAAVQYVKKSLAVEHFALNLWDHGTAWRGLSFDDDPPDFIDVARGELTQALAGIPIDILCADACLAASAEMAQAVDELEVRELVASEELEPGQGWRYADLLQRLGDLIGRKPTAGVHDITAAMVDSYASGSLDNKTISAFNLHEMGYLPQHIDKFAGALLAAGGISGNPHLREIYQQSFRFEYGGGTQIDLGDFALRVASSFPPGPLKSAAQALFCVILHGTHSGTGDVRGYGNGHVWGLSIYGPAPGTPIDPLYEHPSAPWHGSRWIDFLHSSAPQPPGFAIPDWAVAHPVDRPMIPWATNRKSHGEVPVTVRHIAPNQGASISLVGFQQPGDFPTVTFAKDEATRTIEVQLHKPMDAAGDLSQTYGSAVELPVPANDLDTWWIRVMHADSGLELANAYWRRGADRTISEIL